MHALAIALGLLVLGTVFVATLLMFPAMWIGFRGEWRRVPRERRRRGIVGGAVAALLLGVAIALAILAPWGARSVGYVILVGGGGGMLIALVGVGCQAFQDSRKARRRRRAAP